MIHPSTIINCINPKEEKDFKGPIGEFFQKVVWSLNRSSIFIRDYGSIYELTDSGWLIQDWMGWTEIKKMIVFDESRNVWSNIKTSIRGIIVHNPLRLPLYIPSSTKIGFHGEVLYEYETIDINKDMRDQLNDPYHTLRVKDQSCDNEFQHILEISIYPPFTMENGISDHNPKSYLFVTKSGFFNANDIHLLGVENLDGVLKGFK